MGRRSLKKSPSISATLERLNHFREANAVKRRSLAGKGLRQKEEPADQNDEKRCCLCIASVTSALSDRRAVVNLPCAGVASWQQSLVFTLAVDCCEVDHVTDLIVGQLRIAVTDFCPRRSSF